MGDSLAALFALPDALAASLSTDKIEIPAERGAIAQLGERIVRNDEVVGSSPTSSTKTNHLQATFPLYVLLRLRFLVN